MYQFAVIGNPIAHSLSPHIHKAFAKNVGVEVSYIKMLASLPNADTQISAQNIKSFTQTVADFFKTGQGMNVTVPFKLDAFKLCDDVSPRAMLAQAVNTLYQKDGKLYGDNTDGMGLVNDMLAKGWALQGADIAILGAGGAVRGVLMPLFEAGVNSITIANRTLSKAQALVADFQQGLASIETRLDIAPSSLSCSGLSELVGKFDMIINGTSASLSQTSLALSDKLSCAYAYDMVYSKTATLTPFLQHFQSQGAQVADGLGMLIGQASVSFEIWTGKKPDLNTIDFAFLTES